MRETVRSEANVVDPFLLRIQVFRCGCERRADVRFSGTGCCVDHSLPFTAFLLSLVSGSLYRNIRDRGSWSRL